MKFRWTIEMMEEMDDVSFAIAILNERLSELNPYAPLAQKIKRAIQTLESLKR